MELRAKGREGHVVETGAAHDLVLHRRSSHLETTTRGSQPCTQDPTVLGIANASEQAEQLEPHQQRCQRIRRQLQPIGDLAHRQCVVLPEDLSAKYCG